MTGNIGPNALNQMTIGAKKVPLISASLKSGLYIKLNGYNLRRSVDAQVNKVLMSHGMPRSVPNVAMDVAKLGQHAAKTELKSVGCQKIAYCAYATEKDVDFERLRRKENG